MAGGHGKCEFHWPRFFHRWHFGKKGVSLVIFIAKWTKIDKSPPTPVRNVSTAFKPQLFRNGIKTAPKQLPSFLFWLRAKEHDKKMRPNESCLVGNGSLITFGT